MTKRRRQDENDCFESEAAAVDRLFDICQGHFTTCSKDDLDGLLQRYPNAARSTRMCTKMEPFGTRCKKYPLHAACRKNAPTFVVRALLRSWPGAVRESYNSSNLPLHDACFCGKSLDTVQLLVEAWPSALREGVGSEYNGQSDEEHDVYYEEYGTSPLHCALMNPATSVDIVQFLIQEWPECVKKHHALSWACRMGASLPVIQCLVQNWHETYRVQSEDRLSLSTNSSPVSYLTDKLLDTSERIPDWETERYRSSVYAACRDGSSADSITLLIDKWSDQILTVDSYGRAPLHYAAQVNASLVTIQLLVKTCSNSSWLKISVLREFFSTALAC